MRKLLPAMIALAVAAAVTPSPALPGAKLTVSMLVDRVVARPGRLVSYTVRLENVGSADAHEVQVQSHYPEHTTANSTTCPDGMIEPDGDICISPDTPTPGAGGNAHQVQHFYDVVSPGQVFVLVFAVRVDADAPIGFHLRNHAHASAALAGGDDSRDVDTLVVAREPDAAFGASSFTLSGSGETGGNVGSNGAVFVKGNGIVRGDVVLGPSGSLSVSNNGAVTGSVVRAPAAFALNTIDADSYESDNDNRLICAAPGSCAGVAFAAAARTLTVSGFATLPLGVYSLCRLNVSGLLRADGPVAIFIGSPERCGGSSGVTIAGGSTSIVSGKTRDFQVLMQAASSFVMNDHGLFAGLVYGSGAQLSVTGQGEVFGGMTLGAVAAGEGGAFLHIDPTLDR